MLNETHKKREVSLILKFNIESRYVAEGKKIYVIIYREKERL